MHRYDNMRFRQISDALAVTQVVRGKVVQLIHSFFSDKNFFLVDPPILHEQILNKKHEIYLPLYNSRYCLNSSNALYMTAYASLFERVYALSPTFRDEQDSVNHLVEFRMLEGEILSMSYKELPDFVEKLIVFILNELSGFTEIRGFSSLRQRLEALQGFFPIQKISYEDFMCKIRNAGGYKLDDGVDLSDIDYIVSKYISRPVFIMNYPRPLASWTAKRGESTSACAFNLILPETYGELCEGCERNNDVVMLRQKFQCAGIDNLQWYLDAVENIDMPRCGFGIGVDRLVRWIVGAAHIKDTVLFPRMKLQ